MRSVSVAVSSLFVCTEDEQLDEGDDNVSPNDESPSNNCDSQVDTSYSL